MSVWCPVLLDFYIHIIFPDDTLILLGSLFSLSYTASLTAEPAHSLPPHCVNDTHWCNIFFQWKGRLITGSYRACDGPEPGNAECLGGVQDVLKAVHRERSLCGKWFLRHWKPAPSLPHHYKMLPSGFSVLLNLLLPASVSLFFC